jgi:hypothetical protein
MVNYIVLFLVLGSNNNLFSFIYLFLKLGEILN